MTPLHVEGRYIKNQKGDTVHFVGTTEGQTSHKDDTHPYWLHELDPIPMAERMAELGVPWIRITVKYSMWSDPVAGASYRDLIDRYVEEFTSRGIYTMVGNMGNEFARDLANGSSANWENWLIELVGRYKNNPGMCGIYIFNEVPTSYVGLNKWHEYAQNASIIIHNLNPDLLILVQADLPNRKGMDPYWVSNPITVPNAVYVFHDYFWRHYYNNKDEFALSYAAGDYELAKQQMEQTLYDRFFKYAVEYDMPIILEEFGFNGGLNPAGTGYGNEPGWPQSQIDYMDLLAKYKIPWSQYNWGIKTDENYGLTEGDYYTLSSVGEIWQQYLKP